MAAMDVDAPPVLEAQKKKHSDLAEQIDELSKLWSEKLYHQLTQVLFTFLVAPSLTESDLSELYEGLVKPLEKKLDKVKVVQLLAIITKPRPAAKALELIASYEEFTKEHRDSRFMWEALKAEKLVAAGQTDAAKELLDTLGKQISAAYEVNAMIQSQLHKTNAFLWKALSRPQDYFRSSILYMAYTPLSEIPEKDRARLAFEIGVAGLIAPEEFEFGELMQQDLITSLPGSEYEWLKDVLQAFSEGRFELFDSALNQHRSKMEAVPELKSAIDTVLRPKMCALALLELAFRKPKKQRRLGFSEIAEHCRISTKDVEFLVMKAMCANLVKGQIDEVEQLVVITWCKPRILDNARIDLMRERMDAWGQQSDLLLKHLEDMTPELLIS
mmetsp:Transcript_14877/g.32133  ORF Transcript_14877/g.32133 Transcript_14877/m.32133 type:complete len:386 (-) Transcript_14877:43-1200(-)|eukprot:CAMPEP_0206474988 /NCGR_PEP_ID=MMETSP0324_2-20121206/33814_1 /ASSEMBLY_ACC=CAM_ASM_000836 /TAXON_ID=2866 /ORGANISM="Crypthecodinium cohnii, Strain Seligo" /LENGTH=385 /DNA_ID=CAMNT_0053950265 /DNA_START=55 /DNA_END=1212 /DNA_ORIENTATION=-